MKTKKKKTMLAVIAAVFIGGMGVYNYLHRTQTQLSDLALENVEALAMGEDGQEKIFRYQYWNSSECYVLVGGAYAKGRKVSCFSGNEHPVCVDCAL